MYISGQFIFMIKGYSRLLKARGINFNFDMTLPLEIVLVYALVVVVAILCVQFSRSSIESTNMINDVLTIFQTAVVINYF